MQLIGTLYEVLIKSMQIFSYLDIGKIEVLANDGAIIQEKKKKDLKIQTHVTLFTSVCHTLK